jgi:hypothetical protein
MEFKPGQVCERSGIYVILDKGGSKTNQLREVVEGEPFPPTPQDAQVYRLEIASQLDLEGRVYNEKRRTSTRGSSRIWLILVIVLFSAAILTLAVLFMSGVVRFRYYGLGPELTVETIIISIGVLLVFFLPVTLPLMMVAGYHQVQHKMLEAKIKEDLWLCGLCIKQLGSRMEEFGDRNSLGAFALPAVVNLAFVFAMWGVVIMPGGLTGLSQSLMEGRHLGGGFYAPDIRSLFEYMANSASLVTWAFLGAYFYTLMVLIRRWLQSDLTTGVLWKINVRVAVSLIVGLLLMKGWPDTPMFVAFAAGIVPDTVLRWLSQQAKRLVNLEGQWLGGLFKPSDLQEKIDGLNFWQADRLFEEGIESIQDLAMQEIPNLLISTRFDTPHVLYWVDQALLCNQVGDQVEQFKDAFIRTACDLLELEKQKGIKGVRRSIQDAQGKTQASSSSESGRGQSDTEITTSMIENAVMAIKLGPNLPYVQEYWKNTHTADARENRLDDLYERHSKRGNGHGKV